MKKVLCAVLAAALACGLCGCSKGDNSLMSVSESAALTPLDFDEAVKNINLFGHNISLPCTVKDFGEDFSISEKNMQTYENVTTCSLLYQGKSVGTVSFIDYSEGDDLNCALIDNLSLGFIATDDGATDEMREKLYESRGWYSGLIEFEIAGLSFKSTVSEAEKVLGTPATNEGDDVVFDLHTNGGYIQVDFHREKVKRFNIGLNGGTKNEH